MTTKAEARERREIPKAYDHRAVERPLYKRWEEGGYFTPAIDRSRPPFTIIMPPPNVSGELHVGSAMFVTLEDILTRWHRMRGDPTLWLPGADHAAIAVHVAVERQLDEEGLDRHQLGREKFLERVWQWIDHYRPKIQRQLRDLGASCDWSRERFTMDPGPQKAVRTTFVRLYNDGLIYRGERIINWCPRCRTALSELEVDHVERRSHLWYVRYPLIDSDGKRVEGEYITIATTRPETIVADVGVAVHPEDERHKALIGREALLPIIGRRLKIVGDEAIDPEFGAGALKVTPGHDPVDFEIGQRHGLPTVSAIALDATMTEEAGPYKGQDRFECRDNIVRDLDAQGFLVKTEPYSHSIAQCHRCDTIVEPLITPQWYVTMPPLAAPAIEAVKSGKLRFVPKRFERVYLNWLENIRDWPISRQLWFGHAIPVWYCDDCGEMTVAPEDPTSCSKCESPKIRQETDVLDTWFSSALWPYSTLGWPEKTEDLDYFYPTSVMETAYDIIFFWVARMVMTGLYNMGELPFHTVYFHGLVRAEQGEKISKSRVGRAQSAAPTLDETIESFGADALRYTLATSGSPGNDMKLSSQKLEAARNFANKLWNAARFVLTNLENGAVPRPDPSQRANLPLEDRWILSRLNRLTATVERLLERFDMGEAGRQVHDFVWGEFCDWYVEMAKVRLRDDENAVDPRPVLVHVLDTSLRLLHPYMPYVTEEVWSASGGLAPHLPDRESDMLIAARFPATDKGWLDEEAERETAALLEVVRSIRNIRAERRVEPARLVEAYVQSSRWREAFAAGAPIVKALARVDPLHVESDADRVPRSGAATAVLADGLVALPLTGLFDVAAERERLTKQLAETEADVARLDSRLANQEFRSRAPANVVKAEEERLAAARSRLEGLRTQLSELL